jgi:hypothetical protein
MNWSDLPTTLRTVLGAALLLVIGVAVASFTLSFIALREVAATPITGWGRNAWIFPACVDMGLLASEVVLVGVSMIKGVNRAVPFVFMVVFGALTVWFNIARVPADWRLVTAVPPVAGLFMTLLIAFLLKTLAVTLGKPLVYHAPGAQFAHLGSPQTTVVQLPDGSYGVPQNPRSTLPEVGRNGHSISGRGPNKRAIVESYLSGLGPETLGVLTARQVAKDLTERGYPVTERTVVPVLAAARNGHG